MKRLFLVMGFTFMLAPHLLIGQTTKNQVFYALLETEELGNYTLDKGTLLGVEKGNEGAVYLPPNDETNSQSKRVGEFKIVSADENTSNVEVEFSEDVSEGSKLYAEFTISPFNPHYTSVVSLLVGRGIVFTNIYQEEIIGFQNREDGALGEYLDILDLVASAKNVAKELKGEIDDQKITEGAYAGNTLFGVLENSTYQDVYSFLVYVNEHWELYYGNTWMFAEVYATWFTSSVAKMSGSLATGAPSVGISLLRDFKYSNFPVVAELQPAYWNGIEDEHVATKALVTRVNGISMFNKTVQEVYAAIGTEEYGIVSIEFFNHGVFESYDLPLLKVMDFNSSVDIEDLEMRTPNVYPVVKNEKWGLIDGNGDYLVSPKYDKMDIFFEFNNGLAKVQMNKKDGFINMLGEEIIPPQYNQCKSFSEGFSALIERESEESFSDEYLVGFIDVEGNRVSTMKYTIPSLYIGQYHGGMCEIEVFKDGNLGKGYLNTEGELVIPMKYYSAGYFTNGYAIVSEAKESNYGTIDKKGNYVLSPTYSYINDFNLGEALANIDDHYWLIDEKGNRILDFKGYKPKMFGGYTHDLFLIFGPDKKMGMMNRDGKVVIEPTFKTISGVSRELMSASMDASGFDEGNWFFINKNGEKVIPGPFQKVSFFNEGVCWVKKDDLWGLIDTKGKWLIEPVSSSQPSAFNGPLSKIDIGDFMNPHYLYVNKSGNVIYNPEKQ